MAVSPAALLFVGASIGASPCAEPSPGSGRIEVVRKAGEKGEHWGAKPPSSVCVDGSVGAIDLKLLDAARAGSVAKVKRALEDGAHPLCARRLYWAEKEAHGQRVRIETPLILAAGAGSSAAIRVLGTEGAIGRDGAEAMAIAVVRGHLESMQALHDLGVRPDGPTEDGTPVLVAIRERKPAALKSLLDWGADVKRPELILAAVQVGSMTIVRALLEAGAGGLDEALGEAKDPTMAKALADAGAVPSDTMMAKLSDVSIAKAILSSGSASPALRGAGGQVALWNAAFEGNAALVHLLLEKGADPNAPLPGGRAALLFETSGDHALRPPCPMVAAIAGFHMRAEIVRDLLKHKNDPNCGSATGGLTPLAAWIRRSWTKGPDGALDVLHALVAAGADPGFRGARGMSAIEDARSAAAQDGGAHPAHGGNAKRAWKALCAELKGEMKAACAAKL